MSAKAVARLVFDMVLLHLKMVILLLVDVYRCFVPPVEKTLQGQLVLVTGSGQNLGRELALELCRQGAILVLVDFASAENQVTKAMVEEQGGHAYAFTCDVADQEAVAALAVRVQREIGHPTFVFNNAGVYEHKPFLSTSPAAIRRLVDVNLLGTIWVTREFLGHMVQHNQGHVVCISSVLGYVGRSQLVPYCASKFGVKGLTEALAEEMRLERRTGVRITAVHPFLISNVTDVKPNFKFPGVFEVLEPREAAVRIIRGVRRNEEEIFIPEKLKPLMMISRILPRKIRRLTADFMET